MFFEIFHFDEIWPPPSPKNDFSPIWAMWYQFRHVWKGQMTCASELKPYFHNNEDPWKKIGTLSTEIGPAATKIVKFLPKKAYLSMSTPNELCIWKWTEDEDKDGSSDKNLRSFKDFKLKIAKIFWENLPIFWTKLYEKV